MLKSVYQIFCRNSASQVSLSRLCSRVLSVLLCLSMALAPVANVQAQLDEDTEAPVLIHRQIDAGVAGELQTFLARVSDDFGISEVTLFYRQGDTGAFEQLNMRPLIDSIGEYMIAVETSVTNNTGLQYYIEAVDLAGNQTNRGFEYAPIILPLSAPIATQSDVPAPIIEAPVTEAPVVAGPVVPTPEAEPAPQSGGFSVSPTAVLIGVGALLALGALVAGGSSDDSPPEEMTPVTPDPGTVTLTIVSDLPDGN